MTNPVPLPDPPSTLPGMTVTDTSFANLKEDVRVVSDTVAEILDRVEAHDVRFDQIDRTLQQILVLVRKDS